MAHYDCLLKYIIVGDVGCGKTSLLARLVKPNTKWTDHYEPTLGLEFGSRNIQVGEMIVKIMVWDTAGQEMFRSIIRSYYKGAIACFLVYEITSRKSFNNVKDWLYQVTSNSHDCLQISLVANKCDLHKVRQVSTEEGERLAEQMGLAGYFQVSAKENIGVEGCFRLSAERILQKIEDGLIDITGQQVKNKSEYFQNIGVKFNSLPNQENQEQSAANSPNKTVQLQKKDFSAPQEDSGCYC